MFVLKVSGKSMGQTVESHFPYKVRDADVVQNNMICFDIPWTLRRPRREVSSLQ